MRLERLGLGGGVDNMRWEQRATQKKCQARQDKRARVLWGKKFYVIEFYGPYSVKGEH